LPNIAVWYPAAWSRFGNVSSVLSIGVTSVVTPLTWLYVPVRIDARLGVQIEFVQKHESNRIPPSAMRSRLGVWLMAGRPDAALYAEIA
jgi:hypothetical protein